MLSRTEPSQDHLLTTLLSEHFHSSSFSSQACSFFELLLFSINLAQCLSFRIFPSCPAVGAASNNHSCCRRWWSESIICFKNDFAFCLCAISFNKSIAFLDGLRFEWIALTTSQLTTRQHNKLIRLFPIIPLCITPCSLAIKDVLLRLGLFLFWLMLGLRCFVLKYFNLCIINNQLHVIEDLQRIFRLHVEELTVVADT